MRQKKEIKLESIARELNTSTVTVSNALNGKKGVGKELRRKICDKAVELGYRSPQMPVPEERRPFYIGVIVAEECMKESASIQMKIYKEIARKAGTKKCLTSLVTLNEEANEPNRFLGFLIDLKMDGLIFIGGAKTHTVKDFRRKAGIPIVGIDFCSWSKGAALDIKNKEMGEVVLSVYESEIDTDIIAKTSVDVLVDRMK